MNKKVLIISYIWPPMEGVGLIRALKFARYLPLYGWEPVILTIKSNSRNSASEEFSYMRDIKVFRTEYRDIIEEIKNFLALKNRGRANRSGPRSPAAAGSSNKPAQSFLRELLLIPDDQIGWRKFAVKAGIDIIDGERIDLIYSTSPPETAHLIAQNLKKHSGLPWVADLRDLWADDHYRKRMPLKRSLLRFIERKVLKRADRLVTVSEPLAQALSKSVYSKNNMVNIIENGFDEDDFKGPVYAANEKLTISYTGKLHKVHQSITILFKVLSDLIKEGRLDRNKIEVNFHTLGYDKPDIASMARNYRLEGVVRELGGTGYDKSLKIQAASDLLLLIQWQGEGSEGWYSAKLFDYMGARRPILALSKRGGIIDSLITKTSSGVAADTEDDLRKVILEFYDEYIKNGRIQYKGIEGEILKHTRKARTEKLAGLFDSLIKKGA